MRKEYSRNEKYAINYFRKNGFDFEVLKQYNSKTKFNIQKDGLSYVWELPAGVENIKLYMEKFKFAHEQKLEMRELKRELERALDGKVL